MTGWTSFFAGFSAPIAAGARRLWPAQLLRYSTSSIGLGIRRTARVQNVLTSLKIPIILTFLRCRLRPWAGKLGELYASGGSHFRHAAVRAIFRESLLHLRCLQRMERGNVCRRGVEASGRTLPLSLAFGTTLVAALYIGLNALFIYAVPLESMK